jgi:transketolase
MFTAGRGYDQIRNSIAYPHLNVKIIGSHAGITVGEDGATHQCIEDLSLMRTIPGMTVLAPCDDYETRCAVEAIIKYDGPVFMRTCRPAVEMFTHTVPGYKFELGKGALLKDGKDLTIIATGIMVQEAFAAAKALEKEGISARLIDMHTIKPLDEEIIVKAARETGAIVTVEEHNIIGGLGGAVSELVSSKHPVPVVRVGINDEFGRSGDYKKLMELYGLTPANIIAKSKSARQARLHPTPAPAA